MIGGVALLMILILVYCCCKKCCGKKKKDKKEVKEKVNMKTVQVLGASYQEKVQPSVDELDYNSEEYYSDASSAVKIGERSCQLVIVKQKIGEVMSSCDSKAKNWKLW